MNVGQDTKQASLLCRSIRIHHRDARIIQVTDKASPQVPGVDEVVRHTSSSGALMYFRTSAFSKVSVSEPTWFLDTDMLLVRPLPIIEGEGFCVREFNLNARLRRIVDGFDLSEHEGKAIGDVYPLVGCTTFSSSAQIWPDILTIYKSLPQKYRRWFGDQEALRIYAEQNPGFHRLMESTYACLPEHYSGPHSNAILLHFKGQGRKLLMYSVAAQQGLL
jgi:hypothetical protein